MSVSRNATEKIQRHCRVHPRDGPHPQFTIRDSAHVIGLIVSSLPGVQFGEVRYRNLEIYSLVYNLKTQQQLHISIPWGHQITSLQ